MTDIEQLNLENTLIALAVEACTGLVSPNMCMISFRMGEDQIDMYFKLRTDDDTDREEASEIATDFMVFTQNLPPPHRYGVEAHVEVVGDSSLPKEQFSDGYFVIYQQRQDGL